MAYGSFSALFGVGAARPGAAAWEDARLMSASAYRELTERFAGRTFEGGLYRIHDSNSGPTAARAVVEAFPEFADRACPFAFDWLGRQFALDSGRRESGEPLVLLLEPGTGEALEVPRTLAGFHDEELVEYLDAALATGFFREWQKHEPANRMLGFSECVGYRMPLFLGGSDSVDNLEVIDLEVYWSICGQLRRGVIELPTGTRISEIASG